MAMGSNTWLSLMLLMFQLESFKFSLLFFFFFPDFHTIWKMLHLQLGPGWATPAGDDEGGNGQRPGVDVGYTAG